MFEAFDEILDSCEKFAAREIVPSTLEADLKPDRGWLRILWSRSSEVGLPVLLLPEEVNGAGQSEACAALVLDALASACAGFASVLALHLTACWLALQADDETRKSLLPRFTNGLSDPGLAASRSREALAGCPVGSGSAGSQPGTARVGTRSGPLLATVSLPPTGEDNPLAARWQDGALAVNGTATLTGSAEVADLFLVFAKGDNQGNEGFCFMADRACAGLTVGENAHLPGLRVNAFAPLDFDRVRVPPEAVLFEGPRAARALAGARRLFHGFVAAMSMGVSRAAFGKALSYARERYQFGKTIIQHQEIQRILGAMLSRLQAGTAAYFSLFGGVRSALQPAGVNSGLVKAFCTEAALGIVLDAIQIHGGYGYMHEYGMEKRLRDVKVLQLLGGSGPCLEIEAIAQTLAE